MVRTTSTTSIPTRFDELDVAAPDYSDLEERPSKRARTRKSTQGTEKTVDGQSENASKISSNVVEKPVRRRLAGRLAMMMSMPIDIFYEIAHHLGPDDLLRLSRSSKALRELLMSKSSKLIWRAAEEAVGLPDCPQDLSSPQYASFVFDTFCTHCLKTRAHERFFSFRVRLCKKCSCEHVKNGRDILHRAELPKEYVLQEAYLLAPTQTYSDVFRDTQPSPHFRGYHNYYEPHLRSIVEKYASFKASSAAQKEFVKERRKIVCQIWPGIEALENWIEKANTSKAKGRLDAILSRQISIFDKLKELGYMDEDFSKKLDEKGWRWNDLVRQPRPLTDRVWSNMRPHLEKTICLRREKNARNRIKERREKLIKHTETFLGSEKGQVFCMGVLEFLELPLSQEVIHSDEAWAASIQKHWDSLKHSILDFSKSRRQEFAKKAIDKLISARHESGLRDIFASVSSQDGIKHGPIDILQHPTAFFKLERDIGSYRLETFSDSMYTLKARCWNEFRPGFTPEVNSYLNVGAYLTDRSVLSVTDALCASVGVTSTLYEMEALDIAFVCMRCCPSARYHLPWSGLVCHFYEEIESFARNKQLAHFSQWAAKILTLCLTYSLEKTDFSDHDVTQPGELALK
ncbi:hypothetical protein EW145_g4074 [Phellinidium pouzarii]|uniref:F-box domain-containing protein n=1 Tax=Phellinidium pouzarii TaxID=167371 RepID=A0A4S4L518_9AGAM|nr:hypothetical protein EW145_g4074 [Phellinidium pouzarii]